MAFPHAGSSATCFFPLSQALCSDVDVLAIQYPGRQDRRKEDNVEDLRTLADLIVPEVLPYADRRLALFGHGMGAIVAFEVAVRLAAAQVVPELLLVTGRRAPSSIRDERVHSYSDAEFVREVKGLGNTDQRLFDDPPTLKMILPGLRSDYRAAELYRYRDTPRLECPVVALIGEDDPMVTEEEALLWGTHTAVGLTLGVMSGDRFFNGDAEVTERLRAWALGRRPALAAA